MSGIEFAQLNGNKTDYEKIARDVVFITYGVDRMIAEADYFKREIPEVAHKSKTVLFEGREALALGDISFTIKSIAAFGYFIVQTLHGYFVSKNAAIKEFVNSEYNAHRAMYEFIDERLPFYNNRGESITNPASFRTLLVSRFNDTYNVAICKSLDKERIEINNDEEYAEFMKVCRACTFPIMIMSAAGLANDKPAKISPFDFATHYQMLFCNESPQVTSELCKFAELCVKKAAPVPKTTKDGKTTSSKKDKTTQTSPSSKGSTPPPTFDDDVTAPPAAPEGW